jgi:diguanylate cyclase (GGDEF)-like protein
MTSLSLNAHTLLFSASLLSFLAATLTSSLGRANGVVRQAVKAWSRAMLCVGVTLLAFFVRGQVPEYVPLVLGNAAIMAFALFALMAYARLFSLRYSTKPLGLAYIAQLTCIAVFHLMGTPREIAVLTLCSILTAELVWVALLIVRHGRNSSAPIRWVATTTLLLLASLFATRVIVTLLGDSGAIDASAQSQVQIVTLLVTSIAIIGSTIGFVLMVHERQHREAMESARRDGLTGVLTRRAFFEELAALERRPGQEFALVLIDVDHFKAVNDEYGHLGGDAVLAHVGEVLRGMTRSSDATGRWGGEEFCVLLPHCDEDEAGRFAKRLVDAAAAASIRMPDGRETAYSISAGYASGRVPDESTVGAPVVRHVLARADSALYVAKRSGRNRAVGAREDALFCSSSVPTLAQNVIAV